MCICRGGIRGQRGQPLFQSGVESGLKPELLTSPCTPAPPPHLPRHPSCQGCPEPPHSRRLPPLMTSMSGFLQAGFLPPGPLWRGQLRKHSLLTLRAPQIEHSLLPALQTKRHQQQQVWRKTQGENFWGGCRNVGRWGRECEGPSRSR